MYHPANTCWLPGSGSKVPTITGEGGASAVPGICVETETLPLVPYLPKVAERGNTARVLQHPLRARSGSQCAWRCRRATAGLRPQGCPPHPPVAMPHRAGRHRPRRPSASRARWSCRDAARGRTRCVRSRPSGIGDVRGSYSVMSRDVHRVGRDTRGQRVVEIDDVRRHTAEDDRCTGKKLFVRRIV